MKKSYIQCNCVACITTMIPVDKPTTLFTISEELDEVYYCFECPKCKQRVMIRIFYMTDKEAKLYMPNKKIEVIK